MRLILFIALTAAGCSYSPAPIICTENFAYGITVTVTDSVTGAPPSQATLIATSGTFVDSVGPVMPVIISGTGSLMLSTAGERAGTYNLVVKSPGFVNWTKNGVVVTKDECHVHGVAVAARLVRP